MEVITVLGFVVATLALAWSVGTWFVRRFRDIDESFESIARNFDGLATYIEVSEAANDVLAADVVKLKKRMKKKLAKAA